MKKILVTGGAGYIGSQTCKRLKNEGYDPIVFDNLSTGHKEFLKFGDFAQGDLRNLNEIRACFEKHQPEAVIHFAAKALVEESVRLPELYYQNNVVGTLNLLQAMVDFGVKPIVFSSTCAVYGVPKKTPIDETNPIQPINPYGQSKAQIEAALRDLAQVQKINFVALRYFNASGADPDGVLGEDHLPESHLIPRVLGAIRLNQPVSVFGKDYPTRDGTCVRDYIHVEDLASAHILALKKIAREKICESFNLGTGRGASVLDVIQAAEEVSGRKCQTEVKSRRPGDPPELVANPNRANSVLHWTPKYADLRIQIEHAWKWNLKRFPNENALKYLDH